MITKAQALTNVQAYLPDDREIVQIIKGCSLEPVNGWRVWQNRSAPFIKLLKNNKVAIRFKNGDDFNRDDIYAQSPPEQIVNSCKVALLRFTDKVLHLVMWCDDEIIRFTRYSTKRRYLPEPALHENFDNLRCLIANLEVASFEQVVTNEMCWVVKWPPDQEALNSMKGELCNQVNSLLQASSNM